MTALLNGAWISQSAWRAAGGGPAGASGQLLLSVNLESALTKMRLRWNSWEQSSVAKGLASSGKPQYSAFMVCAAAACRLPAAAPRQTTSAPPWL
jgi:hypothetical protein